MFPGYANFGLDLDAVSNKTITAFEYGSLVLGIVIMHRLVVPKFPDFPRKPARSTE
jgi:hypothetical protein